MTTMYTTGELAKICNVSVRTVQYYDRQKLVSPSKISNTNRRLYTDEDICLFKLVCLYKNIGFSLEEIKQAITDKNSKLLVDKVVEKQKVLARQILDLEDQKDKLSFLYDEVLQHKQMHIKTIEELESLLIQKKKYQRHEKRLFILLIILTIGIFILPMLGFPKYLFVVAIFLFTIGLIYYHKVVTAYICPSCHRKFTLTFSKDMCTLNNGKKGKLVTCPCCGYKAWMKETYRDI